VNVQVILEDTPRDQHIAIPIVQAVFQYIGRPAKVRAFNERMRSVERATDFDSLLPLLAARSGMVDLFILIVDRDCRAPNRPRGGNRAAALQILETRVVESGVLGPNCHFMACEAWEELEVWLLAGFYHTNWNEIRDHCDPKEAFFEPFAKAHGVIEKPAEGRAHLMHEAIRHYRRIRSRCPELRFLEERVSDRVL